MDGNQTELYQTNSLITYKGTIGKVLKSYKNDNKIEYWILLATGKKLRCNGDELFKYEGSITLEEFNKISNRVVIFNKIFQFLLLITILVLSLNIYTSSSDKTITHNHNKFNHIKTTNL